ncbi:MAG: hypothetical protein AB8G22_19775 [Saprospiraceae bacterium]
METLLGIIALIAFIYVAYNVWAVNASLSTGKKVLWTIAAFFFSIITAIVYYFTEDRKRVYA